MQVSLNRCVFLRKDIKFCSESKFLVGFGSEIQSVGAAAAKARSPKVHCFVWVMTVRKFQPGEQRWLVLSEEVEEGRRIINGFLGEEE